MVILQKTACCSVLQLTVQTLAQGNIDPVKLRHAVHPCKIGKLLSRQVSRPNWLPADDDSPLRALRFLEHQFSSQSTTSGEAARQMW